MHVAQKRPITARTYWSCSWPGANSLRSDGPLLWWRNSDLRNKSAIEHYADPAGPFAQARSYISWQVVNAFLSALASRQRSVFLRNRWTGCDLACDEVGLLTPTRPPQCLGDGTSTLGRIYKRWTGRGDEVLRYVVQRRERNGLGKFSSTPDGHL